MKKFFIKCTLAEIDDLVKAYAASLSSPIESYLEDHIVDAEHFLILMDSQKIGYFSIHNKELLVQFFLHKEYRYLGQEIFFEIKKMQELQYAYVPTCDEFFLAHALDEYKNIERQAYFFKDLSIKIQEEKIDADLTLRLARPSDLDFILERTADFFDHPKEDILKEKIYVATKENDVVGYGIIENSRVLENYSSIGMFVVENFRQKGMGRNILLQLKKEVYKNNRIPIAGCWYYNHNSKKTLQSAGLYSDTRLLKVHY